MQEMQGSSAATESSETTTPAALRAPVVCAHEESVASLLRHIVEIGCLPEVCAFVGLALQIVD